MPKLPPELQEKKKKTTHKSTWKGMEREVARLFSSQRTSLSGGNSKITRSDSMHPDVFVECKLAQRFALWTLYEQTEEMAVKEGKIPIVAIKQKGEEGFLVLMAPQDILKLANYLKNESEYEPSGKSGRKGAPGSRTKSRNKHKRG